MPQSLKKTDTEGSKKTALLCILLHKGMNGKIEILTFSALTVDELNSSTIQ